MLIRHINPQINRFQTAEFVAQAGGFFEFEVAGGGEHFFLGVGDDLLNVLAFMRNAASADGEVVALVTLPITAPIFFFTLSGVMPCSAL